MSPLLQGHKQRERLVCKCQSTRTSLLLGVCTVPGTGHIAVTGRGHFDKNYRPWTVPNFDPLFYRSLPKMAVDNETLGNSWNSSFQNFKKGNSLSSHQFLIQCLISFCQFPSFITRRGASPDSEPRSQFWSQFQFRNLETGPNRNRGKPCIGIQLSFRSPSLRRRVRGVQAEGERDWERVPGHEQAVPHRVLCLLLLRPDAPRQGLLQRQRQDLLRGGLHGEFTLHYFKGVPRLQQIVAKCKDMFRSSPSFSISGFSILIHFGTTFFSPN